MANDNSSGNRSGGGQNRSRNRNRNRSRNRNRGGKGNQNRAEGGGGGGNQGKGGGRRGGRRRSGGGGGNRGPSTSDGGGGGSKRFIKQKVPRRTKPLSLWEKILNFFGLGGAPKIKHPPKVEAPPQPERVQRRQQQQESERSNKSKKPKAKKKAAAQKQQQREPRKPEVVEVTNTRLYVGNLSYDATGEDLEKLFSEIGPVAMAEIVRHQRNQRSKGYAFVEMENLEDAKQAAKQLHDREFMDRPMAVSGAKSAGPKRD